jgi:hypothetical protein
MNGVHQSTKQLAVMEAMIRRAPRNTSRMYKERSVFEARVL